MDSFTTFLRNQRLRIEKSLETPPKIADPMTGTPCADDQDEMHRRAYTRTETVGHQTPTGRKERNIGN